MVGYAQKSTENLLLLALSKMDKPYIDQVQTGSYLLFIKSSLKNLFGTEEINKIKAIILNNEYFKSIIDR